MESKQTQEAINLAGEVYKACGKYLDTLADIYKIFYGEAKLGNKEAPCYKDEFLQHLMRVFQRRITKLRKIYEKIQRAYKKIKNNDGEKTSDYINEIIENSKVITVSLSFDYFVFLTQTIYKNVTKCAEEHKIDLQQSNEAITKTGSSLIDAINRLLKYKIEQDERKARTAGRGKRKN
jgi:hypothetical protein